ncbi:hypothetical protein E1A91_A01G101700v1 [Gossypium mustelinum]|uniref:Uncharacterized protein n=1 Tax=Gossypium mustelinum TaxID=34275 RepID=A0A5D3ADF1_GOSMU|nr:hypothetical protein E1A91_A01G101700v1 [Gossypium mustelinum]
MVTEMEHLENLPNQIIRFPNLDDFTCAPSSPLSSFSSKISGENLEIYFHLCKSFRASNRVWDSRSG